jgi:tetratricopeptide (TPR) repeat protein
MSTEARTFLRAAALVITLAAVPSIASAQQQLDPVRVTASANDRADRLVAKAQALPTRIDQFGKAAKLYEQAADARAESDLRKSAHLRYAGMLRYYTGDRAASVRLLERAAESSSELGDVMNAARAYIDGAVVALEMKDRDHSITLARHAELLTQSPLLAADQRASLQAWFATPTAVALPAG